MLNWQGRRVERGGGRHSKLDRKFNFTRATFFLCKIATTASNWISFNSRQKPRLSFFIPYKNHLSVLKQVRSCITKKQLFETYSRVSFLFPRVDTSLLGIKFTGALIPVTSRRKIYRGRQFYDGPKRRVRHATVIFSFSYFYRNFII